MSVRIRHLLAGCVLAGTVACFLQAKSGTKKPAAEDGEFVIFFSAREIGSEKFAIQSTAESATSSSVLEFRNPAETRPESADGNETRDGWQLSSALLCAQDRCRRQEGFHPREFRAQPGDV